MSLQQQGFDRFPVLAGTQFAISPAVLDVRCSIEIGVRAVTTDHTAKRLLVGPVGSIWIVAHTALLRGVGAPDPDCCSASFDGIPGYLLGDVRQVGGVQISIHGAHFVLHRGHGEVFIGDLRVRVLSKALVDCSVDFLAHMAGQALSRAAARGGKLLDAFLLQALAQLRLTSPLLPVALLSLSEFAVKGAIVLAGTGRDEVRNPDVYADHRGRWGGVYRDFLVITEGQPPAITTLVERHAGIDGLAFERLAVVGSQLDRDQQLLAEFQRADREPVVKGRVLGGFELDSCTPASRVPSVSCSW